MNCKHCDNREMKQIHLARKTLKPIGFDVLVSVFQCRNCGAIDTDVKHVQAELKDDDQKNELNGSD